MYIFFKKQSLKIFIYIIILGIITILFSYYNLDKNTLLSIISLITSIFIAFMGKTWIDDYKLEIDKELEDHKLKINKEIERYKTKLSGYTLVTKLQYDLEFEIYRDLTKRIAKIIQLLIILRTKINEQTNAQVRDSIIEFMNKVLEYQAFYNNDIYESLTKISELMLTDYHFILEEDLPNKKVQNDIYWDDLTNIYREELIILIKKRISNMKIIEG